MTDDQTMTIAEVADVLGVEPQTIRHHVRNLFPEIAKQGVQTKLNEFHVVEIKKKMVPTESVKNAVTDSEMSMRIAEDLLWLKAKIVEYDKKVTLLMHTTKTYSATELAKELGMSSAQELNQKLYELGIQYKTNNTWVLYSKYAELGYTEIKQFIHDNGAVCYDRKFTQKGREFVLTVFEQNEPDVHVKALTTEHIQ